MTAFIPMATRFSVSDRVAAKVAKPAKVGLGPGVPARGELSEVAEVAKVGRPDPVELPQLSQAGASGPPRESLDLPALSQPSQVTRRGSFKSENEAAAALPAEPWLAGLARAIAAAIADGAERKADPDGWLLLARPDGRRLAVAPRVIAEVTAAGLLPPDESRPLERNPLLSGTRRNRRTPGPP